MRRRFIGTCIISLMFVFAASFTYAAGKDIHKSFINSSPPYLDVDKNLQPLEVCSSDTGHVLITVRGMGDPAQSREKLDVMIIIDRSGSMQGEPLLDAKDAATTFIDSLDVAYDKVGLVSYSNSATLDTQLTTDFQSVKNAIDNLTANGYTNIGDRR